MGWVGPTGGTCTFPGAGKGPAATTPPRSAPETQRGGLPAEPLVHTRQGGGVSALAELHTALQGGPSIC